MMKFLVLLAFVFLIGCTDSNSEDENVQKMQRLYDRCEGVTTVEIKKGAWGYSSLVTCSESLEERGNNK